MRQELNVFKNAILKYQKCNEVTSEAKLRSFRTKLNLRVVVTNTVYTGMKILQLTNVLSVILNRKLFYNLFALCYPYFARAIFTPDSTQEGENLPSI